MQAFMQAFWKKLSQQDTTRRSPHDTAAPCCSCPCAALTASFGQWGDMHGPRVPSEGHGLATMAAPMPTAGTCRARLCLAVRPWAARRVGATAGTMTWGATGPEMGPRGQEGPSAHLSRHRTPGVGLPGMPGASCRRGCARGPSRPQCLHLLSGDASRGHQLGGGCPNP